jgi:hypothetical protein
MNEYGPLLEDRPEPHRGVFNPVSSPRTELVRPFAVGRYGVGCGCKSTGGVVFASR